MWIRFLTYYIINLYYNLEHYNKLNTDIDPKIATVIDDKLEI